MKEIYDNSSYATSFSGVNVLCHAANGRVSKKMIQKWLSRVDSYKLLKLIRRKFPTNGVIVYSIDHQWQTDLVDFIGLQK